MATAYICKSTKNENKTSPILSIIITTYNSQNRIVKVLESFLNSKEVFKENMEVIVVDDASTDGTCDIIANKFSQNVVKIIRNRREKFVAECKNIGLKNSCGKYVIFSDDDIIVEKDTIVKLVKFISLNDDVGMAGPVLTFPDGDTVWCAGIRINYWTFLDKFIGYRDSYNSFSREHGIIPCDTIPGIYIIRRELAERFAFDSKLFPIQYEECDFAFKIKKSGYKVVVIPWAKAIHYREQLTSFKDIKRAYFEARNRIIACKLWNDKLVKQVTSTICSILILFMAFLITCMLHKRLKTEIFSVIVRGIIDGLKIKLVHTKNGTAR